MFYAYRRTFKEVVRTRDQPTNIKVVNIDNSSQHHQEVPDPPVIFTAAQQRYSIDDDLTHEFEHQPQGFCADATSA